MQSILKQLANLWMQRAHPRLMSFIATTGFLWLAVCLLLLFGLAELSEEVLEQETFIFDEVVLLWIGQFRNPVLDQVMLFITHLGNPSVVVPTTCIGFVYLWWLRSRPVALIFALNCIGGAVLSAELKIFFNKSRPQLWSHLITETTYSFPSGHALGSMVLYGFLAYLLVQSFPKRMWFIYSLAVLLIGAIGVSRLYLGVHWPTDVMAGYAIGWLWVSVCTALLKLELRLEQKKRNRSAK